MTSSAFPRALGLAAAAALSISASAISLPAAAQPDRDAEIGSVCAHVIGVMAGERHYAACVQSLGQSLQGLRQGEGMGLARRDCLARGFRPNTAGLAECELEMAPAATEEVSGPQMDAAIPGGARSYFMISRATAYQRFQLACAKLGFEPAQDAFGGCVADLRSALARASDPSM
jgi:hypothetical protein